MAELIKMFSFFLIFHPLFSIAEGGALMSQNPQVIFEGLRNGNGHLAISIFREDQKEFFPGRPEGAFQTHYIPLENQTRLALELPDLEPGKYAIAVLHDENSDGQLKTYLKIPREGFGFSNNPLILLGPPAFKKVLVDVTPTSVLKIEMRYLL